MSSEFLAAVEIIFTFAFFSPQTVVLSHLRKEAPLIDPGQSHQATHGAVAAARDAVYWSLPGRTSGHSAV